MHFLGKEWSGHCVRYFASFIFNGIWINHVKTVKVLASHPCCLFSIWTNSFWLYLNLGIYLNLYVVYKFASSTKKYKINFNLYSTQKLLCCSASKKVPWTKKKCNWKTCHINLANKRRLPAYILFNFYIQFHIRIHTSTIKTQHKIFP